MTIKVNHIRDFECGFYIGRGSPLGNPFRIGKDGTREEVIAKFADWLDGALHGPNTPNNQWQAFNMLRRHLGRAGYLVLNCHCAPEPCHGDVLADRLMK